MMWSHHLKTGFRVVSRNATFSAINIFGLGVSMALCLLVLLFIADQWRYDTFHEKADQTYRIVSDYKSPSNVESEMYATSPSTLAEQLLAEGIGVESAVHVRDGFSGEFIVDDNAIRTPGLYVGPDFLKTFDFRMLDGDPESALSAPGSLLLTPESAIRLFGRTTEPVGQVLIEPGGRTFTVTGLIEANPHSHFRFDALASLTTLTENPVFTQQLADWRTSMSRSYTYVVIQDDTVDRLQQSLERLRTSAYTDPSGEHRYDAFVLQPLTDINLGMLMANQLGAVMPRIAAFFLGGFGLVIMLIAGFNYVTLTVARGTTRFKEIGIRRTMGAGTSSIFFQFIVEAVLIALLALLIAAGILMWLLPAFNSLSLISFSENQILIDLGKDMWVYGLAIAFTLAVGILAGVYPARRFTRVNTTTVLAGTGSGHAPDRGRFRKVVTTSQFAFSIVFVVTSFMMLGQFRHMANTDYGFNREHVVNIALQDVPFDRLKNAVASNPSIVRIAGSDKVPGLGSTNGAWLYRPSLADSVNSHHFSVDEAWLDVMGLDLLAGRNFDPARTTDSTDAVILGASAVRKLGFTSPVDAVDAVLTVDGSPATVIGVIADFISADPMRSGDPISVRYRPSEFRYAVVTTVPGGVQDAISGITREWSQLPTVHAPILQVLDDELKNNFIVLLFADLLSIVGVFAFFSVLISCLGLFGMAMYTARHRTREVGIRQALGASHEQVALLLSRETIVMMLFGVAIGTPVAWLLNALWLSNLSNGIEPGIGTVVWSVLLIALLAVATVATQTIRAARTHVVDNLRS
ncbi:MAG: FtsX-like permease family protein [Rhodothermales bacterium]